MHPTESFLPQAIPSSLCLTTHHQSRSCKEHSCITTRCYWFWLFPSLFSLLPTLIISILTGFFFFFCFFLQMGEEGKGLVSSLLSSLLSFMYFIAFVGFSLEVSLVFLTLVEDLSSPCTTYPTLICSYRVSASPPRRLSSLSFSSWWWLFLLWFLDLVF